MSTALARRDDNPAMSLCSICPNPGVCCRSFRLFDMNGDQHSFWQTSWQDDALRAVSRLPFVPVAIDKEYKTDAGEPYVTVLFGCPHVTQEGRCGIYESRPELCRKFTPGNDRLCAFHPRHHGRETATA